MFELTAAQTVPAPAPTSFMGALGGIRISLINRYSWHKEKNLLLWHITAGPLGAGPEKGYQAESLERAIELVREFNDAGGTLAILVIVTEEK